MPPFLEARSGTSLQQVITDKDSCDKDGFHLPTVTHTELVRQPAQQVVNNMTVNHNRFEVSMRGNSTGRQPSLGTPNQQSEGNAPDERSVEGNHAMGDSKQNNWNFAVTKAERQTVAHIRNNKASDQSKQDNIIMNDEKMIEALLKNQK